MSATGPGPSAAPATPAEMREERKVITVLAADLSGSTSLGERLDPEETKLVIGEAIGRIVLAVEELGGTVKDLAGDGVLALFGAPAAHEDDPERAVSAGLRIAREIEAYGAEVERGWGIAGFAVRVGIATGTVVLGPVGGGTRVEYGATGDTVNTAARLQVAASPGTVMVDEPTQRLTRALFGWNGPHERSLKGKSASVIVFEPLHPLHVGAKRTWVGPDTPLVGRQMELGLAGEALEGVLAGAGGILFVTGEAGIGKSRLLAEMRARFEGSASEGGRPVWLEGRCVSYGQAQPFGPFRELLREWVGVGPGETGLRLRVALRRRLDHLFGQDSEETFSLLSTIMGLGPEDVPATRVPELPPRALAGRTFAAFEALLSKLSEEGPVVVALDDVQWSDGASIELAERLLGLTDREPLLLVMSQRLDRDHGSWRLRERALRELPHRTKEIALAALSEEVDGELLSTLIGKETLPPAMHSRILSAAGGNPFFLEELVRSLVDTGVLAREGDGWQFDHDAPVEIPLTIRRVILARMDK
ncbi:MAG TPA: AAA family ATPase, partial [Actinomycetota bacterium]|nr:AAA family ATPase [Actinomycetota bacterium]